jgi:hypothetical protein
MPEVYLKIYIYSEISREKEEVAKYGCVINGKNIR